MFENECRFIGNFVENPEGQDVNDGKGGTTRLLKFRIGVNNRRTKKSTFPNCEVWGKAAELIEQYCKKGDRIGVKCELVTDQWVDKESGENRYRDKYRVEDFLLLGSGKGGNATEEQEDEQGESDSENTPSPAPAQESRPTRTSGKKRETVGAGAGKKGNNTEEDIPF